MSCSNCNNCGPCGFNQCSPFGWSECTPYATYQGCSWSSGPCASNMCGFQPFNTYCYPNGNPFWSFGCGSCGSCRGKKKKDCNVKVITRERM